MKRVFLYFLLLFCSIIFFADNTFSEEKAKKIDLKLFYSSNCKHCIYIKQDYLPKIISKYKDMINIEYLNTAEEKNFKLLLLLENKFGIKTKVPAILIGDRFLVGSTNIESELENIISQQASLKNVSVLDNIGIGSMNLLDKFRTFSAGAIILAGLIDGINPCAFTVIIFFISFLTLMGYKKIDLALIGSSFILAVFLTYYVIGLGLFKGLYELKQFSTLIGMTYFVIADLCFILAYLNLRDFFVYRKTGDPDSLKIKLPKPIRLKINSIIGLFYRKEQKDRTKKPYLILVVSAFIVGFLISLLEALCTGQTYIPTIVFILREPTLRFKAIFFLVLYNLMFIVPLVLILLAALLGISSKKIENFFKNRVSLVKLLMFILFLGLGIFLLMGV